MAFFDLAWYTNFGDGATTGYYAVTQWSAGATIAAGAMRRQLAAPAVGSERVFVCIVAGTTSNPTEPTWVITRGGKTTDNTVTWQECTGATAVNGDLTNTPNWTTVKGLAVTLGQIIKRNNGASYQICSTAGTAGSGAEPAFSDTAGTTTADNTITWTSLGAVGNFTGGQAPHARLANALATNWGIDGNTYFVGDNHAETQTAAMTLSGSATHNIPDLVYCHNHSGPYPPTTVTTGASISTTLTGQLNINSDFYFYGITFSAGSGATGTIIGIGSGNPSTLVFDTCTFALGSTSATRTIDVGAVSGATYVEWRNCSVKFGATGQSIVLNFQTTTFVWKATTTVLAAGSSTPTSLLISNSGPSSGPVSIEGCDFSSISGTLFGSTAGTGLSQQLVAKDCKLNASAAFTTPTSPTGLNIDLIRCDSGLGYYRNERYRYQGITTTATSIIRTNGASDGTTGISWKNAVTANATWYLPFGLFPVAIWNSTLSAINVTFHGVWTTVALPKNDEVWFNIEYLGSASSPLASYSSGTKSNGLATGTALTADTTADWTSQASSYQTAHAYGAGSGIVIKAGNASPQQIWFVSSSSGSGTSGSDATIFNGKNDGDQVTDNAGANQIIWQAFTRFKQTQSITPAAAGYMYAYPYIGRASVTAYIDPKFDIS